MSDVIASYKGYILTGSILSSLSIGAYITYNKFKNPTVNFKTKKYVQNQQGEVARRTTSEFSRNIRSNISSTYMYSLASVVISGYVAYKRIVQPNRWKIWGNNEAAPTYMDLWVLVNFGLVLLVGSQNYERNFVVKHVLWVLSNVNLGLILSFWNIRYENDFFKLALYPVTCTHGLLTTLGIAAINITCDKMIKDGFVELCVVGGLLNGLAISHKYFHNMDNVQNLQFYAAALIGFYVYFYSKKVILVNAKRVGNSADENEVEFDPIYHQLFLMLPVHLYAMFAGFYTAQNLRNELKLLKS